MMWLKSHAVAARKALRMDASGLFFLLTMMTALLGVLLSFTGAGLAGTAHVYHTWQLNQQQSLLVSLLGDTPQSDRIRLEQALQAQEQISTLTPMAEEEVKALLAPFVPAGTVAAVPLPVVYTLDLKAQDSAAKMDAAVLAVEEVVLGVIPTAMLDDNRALLTRVAHVVRFVQSVVVAVMVVVLVVMIGLVMLTVQAGIRTQTTSVTVLKFLGGTDAFVASLVVRQVLQRALLGWALAAGGFTVLFGVAGLIWPVLQGWWLVPAVWGAGFGSGAALVVLAFLVARLAAAKSVQVHG